MTRYPKLLPWLAAKAGVSDALAGKLWRIAVAEAADALGESQSADFHAYAIERLIDLLEQESNEACIEPSPSGWFWRHQRRMVTHSFSAARLSAAWWQGVMQQPFKMPLLAA